MSYVSEDLYHGHCAFWRIFDWKRYHIMAILAFFIAAISSAAGYLAAVMFHHREITNERENNKVINDLERKELNEFMKHVQGIAVSVDEKVDQHSLRLSTINEEVTSDPNNVLVAVKKLFKANVRLHDELSHAQERIDEKQKELESYMAEARTDALTGVANRRAFDEQIHRLHALRQRRSCDICLIMADIDHFKMFNDYHGHLVGDEMLQLVAETFESATRPTDVVCRYGGEEFIILLPRTKLKDAIRVAERARGAVERLRYAVGDAELHVTVSLGAVEMQPDEEVQDFLKRGDDALYAAKGAGRNKVWHEAPNNAKKLEKVLADVDEQVDNQPDDASDTEDTTELVEA